MASGVKSLFGMRSKAEKRAAAEAAKAVRLQQRNAEEESAKERQNAEMAGRRLMRGGRRSLNWQGKETGLAPTFGGA